MPADNRIQHPFWDYIDAVVVTNLDHRIDRWSLLESQLKKQIPEGKLFRYPGIYGKKLTGFGKRPWFHGRRRDDNWGGKAGCTLCHANLLRMSREKEWNTILVLEDDCLFGAHFPSIWDSLGNTLFGNNLHWDICYCGFTSPLSPYRFEAKIDETYNLCQVWGASCGHAYIVKPRVRDWLCKHMPTEQNIWRWISSHKAGDRYWRLMLGCNFKVCVITPSIVQQSPGFSDILGKTVDYQNHPKFRSEIPKNKIKQSGFALRYFLRKQLSKLKNTYNRIRGRIRKFQGF